MDTEQNRQDEFDTIAPAEVSLTRDAPSPAGPADDRGRTRLWAGVVAVLTVTLLGVVFLPDALRPDLEQIASGQGAPATPGGPRDRARDAATQAAGEQAESDDPVAPYEQSRFERERQAVEDLISRLLDLQDQLEERAVERWGAEALAAARRIAEQGDAAFLEERFAEARRQYEAAGAALETLLEAAGGVYATAVARGDASILERDSAAAKDAFDLALAIRPDSEAARRGMQRSEVLDEVLAKVAAAIRRASQGALDEARAEARAALELDGASRPARRALVQVDADILERDYNAALSRGYGALSRGELGESRQGFREADRLRPGSEEAREGLLLVEQASVDRQIAAIRQEAEAYIEAEDWEAAAERFDAALELDGTLTFARQGRTKARARARLHERLEEVLGNPDKLSEDPMLERARAVLAEARRIESPRPQMADGIDRLADLLAVASEPVRVELRSDGATEVTILRVARLGTFEQQHIELRPGIYTATGSRPGYRDIRMEFRVTPETGNGPIDNSVVIRTEEKI